MDLVELALLAVGVAGLVKGYRRNDRNLLLVAAMALFLAGTVRDFASGVVDGLQQNTGIAGTTASLDHSR